MIRLALCLLLLAPAALAAPYAFRGTSSVGATSGEGDLHPVAAGLRVVRTAAQTTFAGSLAPRGDGWEGELTASGGAAGALAGTPAARLSVRVTARAGGYRLTWSDAQGNQGEEDWLASLPPAGSLTPLGSEVFGRALRASDNGNVPAELVISGGNQVAQRLLVTGPEIFGAVERLIAGAEHEVMIQSYLWKTPCQAGDAIFAGLKTLEDRRRQQGATTPVRVFVVIDKHWSLRGNLKNLERDVAAAGLDPRYVQIQTAPFKQRYYGLLHTKAYLVDGARAILTSANVHPPQDAPGPWFELGYPVEGPVCAAMRAEFAQLWTHATEAPLPAAPPPVPAAVSGGIPVALASRRPLFNPFGRRFAHPPGEALLSAFAGAQRRIRILSPQLNDPRLREALVAAARRGVVVEAVLSKDKGNFRLRLPGQGGTNVKSCKRLRAALADDPAALARLRLRWFSEDGQTPIEGDGPGANHAKYCTVDGELAIVGSTNHDVQSMKYSRELALVVADRATVEAWDRQVFEPALARGVTVGP
ncbi:MAG: phosphatidylserine/phosphatidylglycerophosphate/cardiolipin synthase family protein [Planctomycetota bacterium]